MDTQYSQGEGLPPQAGEGQRHHRPDQRYLSLHPTALSDIFSQMTTEQEAGKEFDSWRTLVTCTVWAPISKGGI